MRGVEDVERELTRIFDHVGLNPGETLELRTTYEGHRFETAVRGIDLGLGLAALTTFLAEREGATAVIFDDVLVVTQRDR